MYYVQLKHFSNYRHHIINNRCNAVGESVTTQLSSFEVTCHLKEKVQLSAVPVGASVGLVGDAVGLEVGAAVGDAVVGDPVGAMVGDCVGSDASPPAQHTLSDEAYFQWHQPRQTLRDTHQDRVPTQQH